MVELYRGNLTVKEEIQQIKSNVFYVSRITVAEFIVGAKNKDDFKRTEITDIFIDLFKTFTLSHRPGIADTLIAATALYYHLPICTLNKKHFQFIPGIELV